MGETAVRRLADRPKAVYLVSFCGCALGGGVGGWLTLFVSVLDLVAALLELLPGVELLLLVVLGAETEAELEALVSAVVLEFIDEPLWREAEVPELGGGVSGAEVMSPVSFLEQPANPMRLAAKNAYFFIPFLIQFLGGQFPRNSSPRGGAHPREKSPAG